MKHSMTVLCFILISFGNIKAQSLQLEWVAQMGGDSAQLARGIALDNFANVYTYGEFRDTCDFDPGTGTYNITAHGYLDGFISKCDSAGSFLWAKHIGGPNDTVYVNDGVCDDQGNIYITGTFKGMIDFNPDSSTMILASQGVYDGFILKLDINGNLVWVRQIGGASSPDEIHCYSMAIDLSGDLFITGEFRGSVDFNPAQSSDTLSTSFIHTFVLKLNSNGIYIWALQTQNYTNRGYAIACDGLGNIYVGGSCGNYPVDFDPGPGTYNIYGADSYILKLTGAGLFVWVRKYSINSEYGFMYLNSVCVDSEGSVYVSGGFEDFNLDFDPGSGVSYLSSKTVSYSYDHMDFFLTKLDENGDFLWVRSIGGQYVDLNTDMVLDHNDNIISTGTHFLSVDLNTSNSTQYSGWLGWTDMFVVKHSSSGTFKWGFSLGGLYRDKSNGVAVDNENSVYLSGWFKNIVDFDPGGGVYNLTADAADAFTMKVKQQIVSQALSSDVVVSTSGNQSYYHVQHPYSTWGVVGVRTDNYTNDVRHIDMYASDNYYQQLTQSNQNYEVDYVVFDGHHLSLDPAVETYSLASTGFSVEFEGYTETLSINSTTTHNWPAGDVVEIWDVNLSPGSYTFSMTYNSGTADLNMALFSSTDGNFHKQRTGYIAQSNTPGAGTESFSVNITQSDIYGFVIWSRDNNSASIDIDISSSLAGIWTGGTSSNWNINSNWSDNLVPTSSTDVIIAPGTLYSPNTSWATANAKSISLLAGATLTIGLYDLIVQEDSYIYGTLNLNNSNADLYSYGDIHWEPGSQCTMVSGSELRIYGDWYFNAGNNVQMDNGTVIFLGSSNTFIRVNEPDCNFYDIDCVKTGGAYSYVSSLSSEDLHIHGDLTILAGSKFKSSSFETVILNGSLVNNGGNLQCSHGTFEFNGALSDFLRPNVGDYFNNLIINVTGAVDVWDSYSDSLVVRRDLIIADGTLDCNNSTIVVGNDWVNMVGQAGFLEKTGTVIFNCEISNQNCYGEEFYDVIQTNDGGVLNFYGPTVIANDFYCKGLTNNYDTIGVETLILTSTGHYTGMLESLSNIDNLDMGNIPSFGTIESSGGHIIAGDIVENGLFGSYILSDSSAILDISQGTSTGQYVDLNGHLIISDGTMIVRGGADDSYWPFADYASISMTDGTLDFTDVGIRIHNSPTWSLSISILGGTIRTDHDFRVFDSFNPVGGELEFYGVGNDQLIINHATSALYNLRINKSSGQVFCNSSSIHVNNNIHIIDGTLNSPDDTLYVGGHWYNQVGSAGFYESSNWVCFNGSTASSILTNETFAGLIIDKSSSSSSFNITQASPMLVTVLDDAHFVNGSYKLNSATDMDIQGDMIVEAGAGFHAFNTASATSISLAGDFTDYNMSISFNSGYYVDSSNTLIINGLQNQSINTHAPVAEFGNLIVDKVFSHNTYMDDDIRIKGDLSVLGGNVIHPLISGAGPDTYLEGDMFIGAFAGWISQYGNFHFVGDQIQNYECLSIYGHLGNIFIDAPSYLKGLSLNSDIHTSHNTNLIIDQGHLWTNGFDIQMNGDVEITMAGVLYLDAGSSLEMDSSYQLNINYGGFLKLHGTETNPVYVTSNDPVNYWQFNCFSGGTVEAEWATFEGIDYWGIYIWDGGVVSTSYPFSHCTFLPGVQNGTLLWIENDQHLTIDYASFPFQGISSYNVQKSMNQGSVTFNNYLGAFAGEIYDYDPLDLVDWTTDLIWNIYVADVTCNGGSNALVDLEVSGGTAPYSYLWSNGYGGEDNINVEAGTYWVTITDYYGIQAVGTVLVSEPDPVSINPTSISDVSCPGGNDGQLDFNITGGYPPYTLAFSNGSPTGTNLTAGFYGMFAYDIYGCDDSFSFTVDEPDTFVVQVVITACSWQGYSDGALDLTVSGGTSPYSYIWSNSSTAQDIWGLTSGLYEITITDANACTRIESWLVPDGAAPICSADFNFSSAINCPIITFSDNSSSMPGSVNSWSWDFGDGSFSNIQNPTNNYSLNGSYIVCLTMGTTDGCMETFCDTVDISCISSYDTQLLNLLNGWSMISTYIDAIDPSPVSVFAPVVSNVIIIKNDMGGVYWPAFGVNLLGNLTIGKGYQIKMSAAQLLTITGSTVVPELTPINILAGWSLIGYLRQSSTNIETMLTDLIPNIIIVKNGDGQVYWPMVPLNQIGNMNPGEGYQIKLTEADTLLYPANSSAFDKLELSIHSSQFYGTALNTGSNMTIGIPDELLAKTFDPGDEIGVFSTDGVLVGSVVYVSGFIAMPVFGDDPTTNIKDGLTEGESLFFRHYDRETLEEYLMIVTNWNEGKGEFTENQIALIGDIRYVGLTTTANMQLKVIPNPAKEFIQLEFNLRSNTKVEIELLSSIGMRMMVKNFEGRDGLNKQKLDVRKLPSGSYFIKIVSSGFVESEAVLIIK